ncbi:uncharacterized protein KY384_002575 [Bacidia gigantensis]|uniref:uncharacterized protein n=1 Tax=Bacidia gigantensis TaxID=2732470 RepID=UPI001D03C86F|nr:uncharacterized protein KY384_002575 [Bacidia gigantensis]KAG8532698.1 hypothetical protein KY384_002575 [Bacidia gigantensis]
MSSDDTIAAISSFIEGAPPGEVPTQPEMPPPLANVEGQLADVINDIEALTPSDPAILEKARPAFQKYNEDQLTSVKLPSSSQNVIISQHNHLDNGRYFDIEKRSSWAFDHVTQKVTDVQSYSSESQHLNLISSLYNSFTTHASEYYPTSTATVLPVDSDTSIILLLAANKYSPQNFWNGRLRCVYTYSPSNATLTGTIQVDVHYYEDGNVRLTTTKKVPELRIGGSARAAGDVVREIAKVEREYHEDLNRGFADLNEGGFKRLRRQLPVTRQKVEWEKVGSYRAGREIGGNRR